MSDTVKVSELPAAVTPLAGDEEVMIVQSGTSRRATTGDIGGTVSFANPSASVGLTAVNGVATTASRSDSASALSQAIVPTWTGAHTFSSTVDFNGTTRISGTSIRDTALLTSGTLGITRGGTGQATANTALNALLPSQGGHGGEFLSTDGTDTSWTAAGGATSPDLIFIPANVGGTPGWSDFGTTGGTLIYENTARLSGVFGFVGISLNSVAPSELELKLQGVFAQSDFTSLQLLTWGQTLLTADAVFSVAGGNSIWLWTSPEADMVVSGQYNFRFN